AGESDRWYWAAPVLLDKLSAEHRPVVETWLHAPRIRQTQFWTDEAAKDTSKSVHFQRLVRAFDTPHEIGLGPLPDDLFDVLSQMTLGSPSVSVLRSLRSLYGGDVATTCTLAFSAANEFVNLFNKPEAVAAVRLAVVGRAPYWQKVIRYCGDGCLQA